MKCRRFQVVSIVLALFALLPAIASAHGGGTPILTRVESGPFWLYVFSQSPEPQAGAPYHVSVAVTRPEEGMNGATDEVGVEDAEVMLHFVPASGDMVMVNAQRSAQGPGYYEADVSLPLGGEWNVSVVVTSPLGEGSAAWNVQVAETGGLKWGWIIAGIVSVLAGLGVLAYAFTQRGAHEDTEAPATTAPESEGMA